MTWIEENLDTHKEDRGDVDRSMRGGRKEREKKKKRVLVQQKTGRKTH